MNTYWRDLKNGLLLDAHAGEIGVGLAGIGGWGKNNAISLMKTKKYNVAGVFDINAGAAFHFSKRYKTKHFISYEQLLADQNIIAVLLTVPNQYHFSMVKQALESGKHVFVEKPLAPQESECCLLNELSIKKKAILMVGYQVRREPAFRKIKVFLQNRMLGDPIFAHGIRTLQRPYRDWRADPKACPGGSMEQLGSHFIDSIISLLGRPLSWQGWGQNIPFVQQTADWGHVEMHFNKGIHGIVDTSFSSPGRFEFNLFFERGQLRYDGNKLKLKKGGSWKRLPCKGLSGSESQFIEFAECIRGTREPGTDAEDSILIAKILSSIKCEDVSIEQA